MTTQPNMINLYYDVVTNYGPVPNGIVEWDYMKSVEKVPIYSKDTTPTSLFFPVTMFYHTMKKVGTLVNLYTNNRYTENTYYPLEIQCQHSYNEFTFNDTVLSLLKNKKLKVLILFEEEGADGYTFEPVLKFCKKIEDMGVSSDVINVVLGDVNCTYRDFFKPYKVFGMDWWQVKHQLTCKSRYQNDNCVYTSCRPYDFPLSEQRKQIESFDIDLWNNPEKLFLSYNGGMRYHRVGLVSELVLRNLDKNNYISWNIHSGTFSIMYDDSRIVDHNSDKFDEKVKIIEELSTKSMTIDFVEDKDFDKDDRAFNNKHYYGTYFSIVTETFAPHDHDKYENNDCNILWTTEKTWKPISIGHPFMILGSVGTLKYLRSQGYYTFPELFDESYDNEHNLLKRIDLIVNNVERLNNLSKIELDNIIKKIKPKLKHNKKLFYTKNHKEKFVKLFKEINEAQYC